MSASRNRLVNALRRSMLQRAELKRKVDVARGALTPGALVARGKYRARAKIDDTAHAVRAEFRRNRLPIALAAVAGTLWLLREPIRDHAPRVGRRFKQMANALADRLRPATGDDQQMEDKDEAVR